MEQLEQKKSGFRSLIVYQKAYAVALEAYHLSQGFPCEETYNLRDQMRRSSRAVAALIAGAYKRRYNPKAFSDKLLEASGESAETEVWLEMAKDLGMLSLDRYGALVEQCAEVQRMLDSMTQHPEKFSRQVT